MRESTCVRTYVLGEKTGPCPVCLVPYQDSHTVCKIVALPYVKIVLDIPNISL